MICKKCGAQIGDNEKFCGYCGEPISITSQPINQDGTVAVQQKTNNKSLKLVLLIVIAAIVILVGAILLIVNLGSHQSPEDLAKRYFVAATELDYNTMCDCFALDLDGAVNIMVENNSYLKENLEEIYGTSNIKEIYNNPEERDKVKEQYMSLYGDDYKISCEVVSLSTLSESEKEDNLNKFKKSFFDASDDTESLAELSLLYKKSNLDNAEEMCCVEMKTIIEGSLDKDSTNVTVYCVKVNGAWKVITGMNDINLNL